MTNLAILGGDPIIPEPFEKYRSLGKAEEEAVVDVVRSGCLSGYFGSWEDGFLGGPKVQAFEAAWAERFGAKHVVSVNSNTTGLFAAVGAAGVGPGDEVILPCTTMSATAMAPLIYGGIPVFADIEPDTFCIDVDSVRANLTERTRAVFAVNLFGHAARLAELRRLCDEKGLILIEDNAQAPFGTEGGRYCGTVGHIGVFSLNYHKHIHTGEGGMCCTDDDRLAQRLQMIRNHAEAVVEEAGVADLTNMIGYNYRMTELSAAVGLVQLEAADHHIGKRRALAHCLSDAVAGLEGLYAPVAREGCTHVYYNWAPRYVAEKAGPSRETFVAALQAEGVPCGQGYVRPIYRLPAFRERKAFGRDGYPFTLTERRYDALDCPVAERLHRRELIIFEACAWEVSETAAERLGEAFRKVHAGRAALADWERRRSA